MFIANKFMSDKFFKNLMATAVSQWCDRCNQSQWHDFVIFLAHFNLKIKQVKCFSNTSLTDIDQIEFTAVNTLNSSADKYLSITTSNFPILTALFYCLFYMKIIETKIKKKCNIFFSWQIVVNYDHSFEDIIRIFFHSPTPTNSNAVISQIFYFIIVILETPLDGNWENWEKKIIIIILFIRRLYNKISSIFDF